uniref:Uncharacterized protein n=1 Tax=Oryza brachyantha TaxID=4533 RepID=J3M4K5_ORYBR
MASQNPVQSTRGGSHRARSKVNPEEERPTSTEWDWTTGQALNMTSNMMTSTSPVTHSQWTIELLGIALVSCMATELALAAAVVAMIK